MCAAVSELKEDSVQVVQAAKSDGVVELRGSLRGIGLPQLIRFLSGLQASGCLRITCDQWAGDLCFADGQVVSASFGRERGRAAIVAIVLALPRGRFIFGDAAAPEDRNVQIAADELQDYIDQLAVEHASLAEVPLAPSAIPRAIVPANAPTVSSAGDEKVVLGRSAMRTLLAIDGRRTIAELGGEDHLVPTLHDLTTLLAQDLVCIDAPPATTVPQVAPAPQGEPARSAADQPTPSDAAQPDESTLRYWLRPIILALVALALLGVTWRCSGVTSGSAGAAPAPGEMARVLPLGRALRGV
jgi:hypothetical protein